MKDNLCVSFGSHRGKEDISLRLKKRSILLAHCEAETCAFLFRSNSATVEWDAWRPDGSETRKPYKATSVAGVSDRSFDRKQEKLEKAAGIRLCFFSKAKTDRTV